MTGSESVFAGLTEAATTVAVDKSTGNVYVGLGCQHRTGHIFQVNLYGPGGSKLAEGIASGTEFKNAAGASGAGFNKLAVNEETKTLYATDGGHEVVQVFKTPRPRKPSPRASPRRTRAKSSAT